MTSSLRWTSADLDALPDDGKRYEIIDGELYVSKQPQWHHQVVCGQIFTLLQSWSLRTDSGGASIAPGVIFAEDDDVAPDVVWASTERLTTGLGADGHLYTAPELVVEVLSPGPTNAQRDRDVKLKLYSRRGVDEYWIVDWPARTLTVYRRDGDALRQITTLTGNDTLASPLLPGFITTIDQVFAGIPTRASR